MENEYASTLDKVNFSRWTNKAKNAKQDIARAFLSFAFILKEIFDNSYFDFKYNTWKDYCVNELEITVSTSYDYIKIARFVEDNKRYLAIEKAEVLGHRKLKMLTQKLSGVEIKYRKVVLKNIKENDPLPKIKEKIKLLIDGT